jgi:hypothetical protein
MAISENIDTGQHAGTHPEYTGAWSDRVMGHMPEMRVLGASGLVGIRNKEWRNVTEHSLVVNATANFIAQELAQNGVEIDLEVVDKASLLHDVSKRFDKDADFREANAGRPFRLEEILSEAGYPRPVIAAAETAGRTVTMYVDPSTQRSVLAASSLEELVVAYADARVRNTDIVSLKQARDGNADKIPHDASFYNQQWYPYFQRVEERLFRIINASDPNFTPDSINNESVTAMVTGRQA